MAFSLLQEYERWKAAYGPAEPALADGTTGSDEDSSSDSDETNSDADGTDSGEGKVQGGPWIYPWMGTTPDPNNWMASEGLYPSEPEGGAYYFVGPDGSVFWLGDEHTPSPREDGPDWGNGGTEGGTGQESIVTGYVTITYSNWSYTIPGMLGTVGNDLISGSSVLIGGAGNDTLTGSTGYDTLDGGTGNDLMQGGAGNDTYRVDTTSDQVVEYEGEGSDTVLASVDWTLGANIENLTLIGSALTGTGNELNNTITGTSANNTLDGGDGHDSLWGGDGNDLLRGGDGGDLLYGSADGFWDQLEGGRGSDHYFVDGGIWNGSVWTDTVIENADEGRDMVTASVDWTLGANFEDLFLAGSALTGTGNELDNSIYGNDGANTLDGGDGYDKLYGRDGNDVLLGGADADLLDGGNGNDVLLGGADADLLDGGSGADSLVGGAGNDILIDGAGNDTLCGGAGSDTYYTSGLDQLIENAGEGYDTVKASVNWTLGANFEELTLSGESAVYGTGNSLNNRITGSEANNVLDGGAGNDTLGGGWGNDTLDGATDDANWDDLIGDVGDDTYIVNGAYKADGVTVEWVDRVQESNPEGGIDTVISLVSYTLGTHVENLILSGSATAGTGNELNNTITGNFANNTLDGRDGHDSLCGGAGNDKLIGGLGNDTLDGATGSGEADHLIGGAGDDTYMVDNTWDWAQEDGGGIDTVIARVNYSLQYMAIENLTLSGAATSGTGNGGANVLIGNGLANTLTSGGGFDTMTGGDGDDVFVFTGSQGGVITDFQEGMWNPEQIHLNRSLFANFQAVVVAATQVGSDTVIAKDGFQLTLKDVEKSQLDSSDFFFI